MRHFILAALNQNFRPGGEISAALFPDDEFDANEALALQRFCERIRLEGYDFIVAQKAEPAIHDLLDLAAGYGHFVERAASPWYLGVFIVAELVMEPYARESFYEPMLRSSVLAATPANCKSQAQFLMLLAFFCDRLKTTTRRVEQYLEDCADAGFPLDNVEISSFCQLKQLKAVSPSCCTEP